MSVLKNTAPAERQPEMPEDRRRAIAKAIGARVEVLNRLAFIGGCLTDVELAGLVTLAEAALRDRRVLALLTPELAKEALAQVW